MHGGLLRVAGARAELRKPVVEGLVGVEGVVEACVEFLNSGEGVLDFGFGGGDWL